MAVRAKRPAGQKTREAIMEGATCLFLRQGYHATGMREIAREAGISLGSTYNHFSSKEEIFEAVLAERNLYRTMAASLSRARGETVAQLVESGFAEIMAALQGREHFVPLMFIDVLEFQARHVSRLAGAEVPRILEFFRNLYVLGRQTGELRDISPVLFGRAYLQLVFSSFILENVVKVFAQDEVMFPLSVDNWQKGLMDILLHGVLEKHPTSEGG